MIENIHHWEISKKHTTVSYYLTPIKVAAIIKRQKRSAGGHGEVGSLVQCCWKCEEVRPLWKCTATPQTHRDRATLWSSNALLDMDPKELKAETQRDASPHVHMVVEG